jgi:hypothetical protein
MYEKYKISQVVEITEQDGRRYFIAYATSKEAEDDVTAFIAHGPNNGIAAKRLLWTLWGIKGAENGIGTKEAIAERPTEQAARELLESILGTVDQGVDGFYYLRPGRGALPQEN